MENLIYKSTKVGFNQNILNITTCCQSYSFQYLLYLPAHTFKGHKLFWQLYLDSSLPSSFSSLYVLFPGRRKFYGLQRYWDIPLSTVLQAMAVNTGQFKFWVFPTNFPNTETVRLHGCLPNPPALEKSGLR